MQKRISDMTPADKASFQLAFRRDLESRGRSWREIEAKIQDEIDATFDDEKLLKMSPDFMIDAAYARKEFKEKPELVDYLLWELKFVTHSDVVEW